MRIDILYRFILFILIILYINITNVLFWKIISKGKYFFKVAEEQFQVIHCAKPPPLGWPRSWCHSTSAPAPPTQGRGLVRVYRTIRVGTKMIERNLEMRLRGDRTQWGRRGRLGVGFGWARGGCILPVVWDCGVLGGRVSGKGVLNMDNNKRN